MKLYLSSLRIVPESILAKGVNVSNLSDFDDLDFDHFEAHFLEFVFQDEIEVRVFLSSQMTLVLTFLQELCFFLGV